MEQTPEKPFYDLHVFCCVNQRDPGDPRGDCSSRGSVALHAYLKARVKTLRGLGRVRINQSGCLDRCALGPVMVIYPQGVWYHYRTEQDVDEIIQQQLVEGKPVQRLLLGNDVRTLPLP